MTILARSPCVTRPSARQHGKDLHTASSFSLQAHPQPPKHQHSNNQTSTQTTDGQENMKPHNTSMPRTRRRQALPRRPKHDSIRHREWQHDPAITTTPVRKTQRATGTQTNSETRKQRQIRLQMTTSSVAKPRLTQMQIHASSGHWINQTRQKRQSGSSPRTCCTRQVMQIRCTTDPATHAFLIILMCNAETERNRFVKTLRRS